MKTEKYLSVTAACNPRGRNARYVEDMLADKVRKAVKRKGGRISNYSLDWLSDPKKFTFDVLVWREADSSWAEKPLNNPKATEAWLRKLAKPIKKALSKFLEVEVRLITNTIKEEVLT